MEGGADAITKGILKDIVYGNGLESQGNRITLFLEIYNDAKTTHVSFNQSIVNSYLGSSLTSGQETIIAPRDKKIAKLTERNADLEDKLGQLHKIGFDHYRLKEEVPEEDKDARIQSLELDLENASKAKKKLTMLFGESKNTVYQMRQDIRHALMNPSEAVEYLKERYLEEIFQGRDDYSGNITIQKVDDFAVSKSVRLKQAVVDGAKHGFNKGFNTKSGLRGAKSVQNFFKKTTEQEQIVEQVGKQAGVKTAVEKIDEKFEKTDEQTKEQAEEVVLCESELVLHRDDASQVSFPGLLFPATSKKAYKKYNNISTDAASASRDANALKILENALNKA